MRSTGHQSLLSYLVLGCQRPSSWRNNARRFWKRSLGSLFHAALNFGGACAWARSLYPRSSKLICVHVSSSTLPTIPYGDRYFLTCDSAVLALNHGETKTIRALSRSFAAELSLATFCRSVSSVLISGKDLFFWRVHNSFDIVCKCTLSRPAVLQSILPAMIARAITASVT